MRIPNYRVYVKATKKMYGEYYDGFAENIRACGEPDTFGADVQIVDEAGMYQSYSFDEVEIMEHTGHKDKNGIKIWEGDVLDTVCPQDNNIWLSDDGERAVVTWDESRSKWDMDFYSCYGGEGHLCIDETLNERLKHGWCKIGNIYEHEHLLEK